MLHMQDLTLVFFITWSLEFVHSKHILNVNMQATNVDSSSCVCVCMSGFSPFASTIASREFQMLNKYT